MSFKKKIIKNWLLIGMCSAVMISGCASGEGVSSDKEETVNQEEQASPEASGMYKPSERCIPSQDKYELSYMGLDLTLPESLLKRMDDREAAMINLEEAADDGTAFRYAMIVWKSMTEEQRDEEVPSGGSGFYDWADSLTAIGAIGAYQKDIETGELDTLTGCTEHREIGKSGDGAYMYYLSVNPDADSSLQEDINNISYEFTDMMSLQEIMGSDEPETSAGGNLGDFTMQDIHGETYTREMFADHDLTMVNVFTTWCSPCIKEIPDLQKLHQEMADQGVQVVGIVLDAVDASGKEDDEAVEKARVLEKKTEVTYPFLIPDAGYMNGRLAGINAVPETFFVDKDGNIVGETYSGSHSLKEWKSIVEKELKGAAQ